VAEQWEMDAVQGTAVGPTFQVAVEGDVVAVVRTLWDDETGVSVSVDWQGFLGDLSPTQARSLAEALRQAADVEGPQAASG
jgi:hypothetical protein